MLRQISLGSLGLVVGGVLSIVGTIAYATGNATLNLAGWFYGIPLFLGGMAFKSAELRPVPFSQPTPPDILALRKQQATPNLTQVLKDVTRYRYGENAHLDTALNFLGLKPTDEERPDLQGVREQQINGAYALVLEFDSPMISIEAWQQKQDKLERFFGPGIRVELSQPQEEQVDVALIVSPQIDSQVNA